MSRISQDAAQAFLNGNKFSKSNTTVVIEGSMSTMLLHGNAIAVRTSDGRLEITNAGWNTTTTNSRLRAVLYEYCDAIRLQVIDYEPYLVDNLGYLKGDASRVWFGEYESVKYEYSKAKWYDVDKVINTFKDRVGK